MTSPKPKLSLLAVAVSSLLALLGSVQLSAAADKPNVLLIFADQWRAQAFGYAGDPNVHTPAFDRFEKQCVNFTHAVSGTPVCSPTRATLLTGQRPLTHGVFINDVPLDPAANTMAKLFKTAGYETGCIGKWHIDAHGRSDFIPRERRQGFDYWKVLECTHSYNRSFYYGDSPERQQWEGYDAQAQTADAAKYIRDHAQSDKPFLLYLSWGPPHNPYETAPAKYRDMYKPADIKLRPNVPADAQQQARRDLAGYYAHCTALDDCLAQLQQALRDAKLADNTIVVFTSDHGDMLGSHDLQRKQWPYDESVRVPMLWQIPAALGIKPGPSKVGINTEDILPTLLSLAKLDIPKSVEGHDLAGALRGGPDPTAGAALIRCVSPFSEFARSTGGREYRGLRTAQYTYVRSLDGPWLAFDNDADPLQLDNLVGKPAFAEQQARLEALLKARLATQHDEFLPAKAYLDKWHYKVNVNGAAPYKS